LQAIGRFILIEPIARVDEDAIGLAAAAISAHSDRYIEIAVSVNIA
jgi:hypothetical protein